MGQTDISWPTRPEGITFVGRFPDSGLQQLAELLRVDERSQWYELIQPPETPGLIEAQLPDYDHEAEIAAVPDEPTDEYRQQALDYVEAVLETRERLRPESLRLVSDLPDGIGRTTSRYWVRYHTTDAMPERTNDLPKSGAKTIDHGKYLFFTPDETRVLENIIVDQFQSRPFSSAKVPTIPHRREEAVLCLYYQDDRYRVDLRETYQNEPEDDTYDVASPFNPDQPVIKPRGFKTDAATRRGEYSDRFKQTSK